MMRWQRALVDSSAGRKIMATAMSAGSTPRTPGEPARGRRRPGQLSQDPRPVPGAGVPAHSPAVCHVGHRLQGHLQHLVAGLAADAGDEPHAAGVVLEAGIVEPDGSRKGGIYSLRRHPGPSGVQR